MRSSSRIHTERLINQFIGSKNGGFVEMDSLSKTAVVMGIIVGLIIGLWATSFSAVISYIVVFLSGMIGGRLLYERSINLRFHTIS